MFKFILLIFTVTFSVSVKTFAQNGPKPSYWAEDDVNENESPDHFFYKRTRLECVRRAIQTKDLTPSPKYLAAIALKARNDIEVNGSKKENFLMLNEENYDYRYAYLNTVARYISTYGVCANEGKNNEDGVEGFESGQTKQVATFIATPLSSIGSKDSSGKPITLDNDTVAKMIAGEKYDFIDDLFTNVVDGKPTHYRYLSQEQRKELAKKGTDDGENRLHSKHVLLISPKDSFSHCLSSMKKHQKQKNLKEKSKQLCQAIMDSCGYKNATLACVESQEKTAPLQNDPNKIVPTERSGSNR